MLEGLRRWHRRRLLLREEEHRRQRLLAEAEKWADKARGYWRSSSHYSNSTWQHPFPTEDDKRIAAECDRWAQEAYSKALDLRREAAAPRRARLLSEAEEARTAGTAMVRTAAQMYGPERQRERVFRGGERLWKRAEVLRKEAERLA